MTRSSIDARSNAPNASNSLATRIIHAGSPPFVEGTAPVNVPVERTSTVRHASTAAQHDVHARRKAGENIASYGRHGSQTHHALEDALLALEGGVRVFLVPSGLSAISLTFLALLSPGDHVVVTDSVYAPVRRLDTGLLQRLGIDRLHQVLRRGEQGLMARTTGQDTIRRHEPGVRDGICDDRSCRIG